MTFISGAQRAQACTFDMAAFGECASESTGRAGHTATARKMNRTLVMVISTAWYATKSSCMRTGGSPITATGTKPVDDRAKSAPNWRRHVYRRPLLIP